MLRLLISNQHCFWNKKCNYCDSPNRQVRKCMLLDTVLSCLGVQNGTLCGFQARVRLACGEPLTFYREALEATESINCDGQKVTHSMQTNGTLKLERPAVSV